MHQMFERLGFTTTTANAIIYDQGIGSLDEVHLLKPSDVEPFARLFITLVVPFGMGIKMC